MSQDLAQYLDLSHSDGTTILKIMDPQVLAEEKDALYSLVGSNTGPALSSQVVLNLENVHSFKSVMIATLITFQKKLKEQGATLKICCIHPDIMRLFELTKMDQILDLRKNEQDAIGSFRGASSPGWFSRLFGAR